MNRRGFTLIELIIVIIILGILAAVALPKFVDITTDAKISATKGGLAAVRSVVALQYAKRLMNATSSTAPYNFVISTENFFDNKFPLNQINGKTGITQLAGVPAGTNPVSADYGWWYVTTSAATGAEAGQAGAYGSATQQTSDW